MSKKLYVVLGVLVIASMLLAACGKATPVPTEAPAPVEPTEVPATEVPPEPKMLVGQVTDMGGIDDKSFNQNSWKGVQDAMAQLGIEGKVLESQQQSDYAKNIQQFVDEGAAMIVTVGFALGVDTANFAKANPDINFAIVDYAFPDCWPGAAVGKDCGSDVELPNVVGMIYQTDEASFLAGYLAAGMTKTGTVGTFGGVAYPSVTIFMKGFEAGVKYYNQKHGTTVKMLGWDNAKGEGLFTGDFESTDNGRKFTESLMQEGADIVMPVAGPVGAGTAAVCKETMQCLMIGVDADWYLTNPTYKEVYLTSVLKALDLAVFNAVKSEVEGTFKGGTALYALKDNGVGLAPFHDLDSQVPADLKAELEQVKADISSGAVTVDGVLAQ